MTAPSATAAAVRGVRVHSWAMLLALLLLFALSGASGLIYQVVWLRMLALTFGVTAYAVSTVLSCFFAGLALGSYVAGRYADRLRSPLRTYAAVEVLVAVLGVLTPATFAITRAAYVGIVESFDVSGLPALTVLRVLLAFLCLILPATLMGATLPLMVRSSLVRSSSFARNVSLLYAFNTLGAMTGAFVAGFELIGRFGLRGALIVAAACNLLAAGGAFLLSTRGPVEAPERIVDLGEQTEHPYPLAVQRVVLWAFAVSGGVSLAYEVVWTRMLATFFDATVYGFTAMLTMVLFGIGIGSWLISPFLARRWNWPLVFAGIQGGVGLLGLLSVVVMVNLIPLGKTLGLYEPPGPYGHMTLRFMGFSAAAVVLPPMLLLGASFPVAARIVTAGGGVGRRAGGVYAVNVLGGIAGSLIAGFIVLPLLGAQSSLLLFASLNLALVLVVVLQAAPSRRPAMAAAALGLVAIVAAVVASPELLTGIYRERLQGEQVVFVDEGLENTIAVTMAADGERKLYINGQPQTYTSDGIANYLRMIGHLPMLLHPDPKRALVIGLGGGATGGAVSTYTGTEVDLVELSSAVVNAAPWFEMINEQVLERPNVNLKVQDGRNFLLLSPGGYDVITADIIRPEHAGASNLYSKEYFALARDALAEGGLMLQWLEQLSDEQYRLMLRAFVETFPYVTLWSNGSLAIGSQQPLMLTRAGLADRIGNPGAAASLARSGLDTPDKVLSHYTGNRDEALRFLAGDNRAITDNHPYAEFHRSLRRDRRPPDVSGFSRDLRQVLKDE